MQSRINSLTKNNCITSSMKQWSWFRQCILEIQQFWESHYLKANTYFWQWPLKNYWSNFIAFLNLYQHAKNQFIPPIHSWDTSNFTVSGPACPCPLMTITQLPSKKNFNHLWIFIDLFQNAKNKAIASFCSENIVELKSVQSDWLRAFCSIYHESNFADNEFVSEHSK